MAEYELDQIYILDGGLVAVQTDEHLMRIALRVTLGPRNFTPRFPGDPKQVLGDAREVIGEVRCEPCYALTIKKNFLSAEGADDWLARREKPTTVDIVDCGWVSADESPELARWSALRPRATVRHFQVSTLLNTIDIIAERFVVVV